MRKIQPLIEMKLLVNNEGKQIVVDEFCFAEVKKSFDKGIWMVVIKDVDGNIHSIIVPNQKF